jgi:hypothetical protein
MLSEVENDRYIAALSRQARTGAAGQNGSTMFSAAGDCGLHILCIEGKNKTNRDLAVI